MRWSKHNRIENILIRLDSTVAVHRVKDRMVGPGQEIAIAIRKIVVKIKRKIHIE